MQAGPRGGPAPQQVEPQEAVVMSKDVYTAPNVPRKMWVAAPPAPWPASPKAICAPTLPVRCSPLQQANPLWADGAQGNNQLGGAARLRAGAVQGAWRPLLSWLGRVQHTAAAWLRGGSGVPSLDTASVPVPAAS